MRCYQPPDAEPNPDLADIWCVERAQMMDAANNFQEIIKIIDVDDSPALAASPSDRRVSLSRTAQNLQRRQTDGRPGHMGLVATI